MQVSTTFRHMEQSEALKSYAEEKLDRVTKYIDEPISAQVYFSVEKIRHIVEIVISGRGITTKLQRPPTTCMLQWTLFWTRLNAS